MNERDVPLFEGGQSIDTSEDTMWSEIQVACQRRDEIFSNYDEQLERFTGPHFRGKGRDAAISPENPDYEWFALMRAQIVAGKPGWVVAQRRADVGRVEALSVRHGLDRWSVETNLKRTLRKFFADWAFRKCVAYVRRVPAAGSDLGVIDGPPQKPQLLRISPRRYIYDPMAVEHEDTRWRGHETIVPLPLLLKQAKAADEDAGWRVDDIAKLQPGGDLTNPNLRPRRMRNELDRKEIHVFEIWVPEEDLGDDRYTHETGYHGVLHTYASTTLKDDTGKHRSGLIEIREPQPYFGPPWGPYLVSGQEYVPDEIEPLSLFVATEANVRSFQRRARVISDALDSYKNVLFVGTTDQSLPGKVHNSRHRGVIPVKGLSKDSFFPAEIGGITAQLATQYQWDSDRIDRLRGLTDAMRGNVTGVATATENALAQSGAAARTNALRDVWYEFVADIGRTVAWYMVEDDQSIVPLPPEAADMLGAPMVLVGGQGGVRWDDLEIDVEPLSMEYKSSQQRRMEADQRLMLLMNLSQAIVAAPWINWDQELTNYGNAYGDPLFREVVNYQLAGQVAGVMLGAQLMGAGQTGAPPEPQPKLTKDTAAGRQPVGGQARSPAQGAGAAPKRAALPGQRAGSAASKQAKAAPGAR